MSLRPSPGAGSGPASEPPRSIRGWIRRCSTAPIIRTLETFVREAIQNSLDARLDPNKPVYVNFTFHSDSIGPRRPYLEQVIAHRKKAGLEMPHEWSDDHVRWLVVEDFNSKGLCGSLASRTSDFWNYWLNFGLSNKDGSGRGGRGIGRVTFLIASRLQSSDRVYTPSVRWVVRDLRHGRSARAGGWR